MSLLKTTKKIRLLPSWWVLRWEDPRYFCYEKTAYIFIMFKCILPYSSPIEVVYLSCVSARDWLSHPDHTAACHALRAWLAILWSWRHCTWCLFFWPSALFFAQRSVLGLESVLHYSQWEGRVAGKRPEAIISFRRAPEIVARSDRKKFSLWYQRLRSQRSHDNNGCDHTTWNFVDRLKKFFPVSAINVWQQERRIWCWK